MENTLENSEKEVAVRYDADKLRYDLLPTSALEELTKIITMGAKKYAPRNWEKGMNWSRCIASLKRHLAEFEKGVDYDSESGLLHIAHVMCNAAFLTEYYRIHPQGDDRNHHYLNVPRIGLDIDNVLADFTTHFYNWYKIKDKNITHWNDPNISGEKWDAIKNNPEFWSTIPVLTNPADIPFEPVCYITHRVIPNEVTEMWLNKNGFPTAKVITVTGSKVQAAKDNKLDIFVDDKYENFIDLNKNGVCCFLFDASHNDKYNVGYKRITSLKELCKRLQIL